MSEKHRKRAPRESWEHYGLEDKACRKKLQEACRSGEYLDSVKKAAYQASDDIAEYLIKAVTEGKSYNRIEFDDELGRICVGHSDFYGYRRLFYHIFDEELKKETGSAASGD